MSKNSKLSVWDRSLHAIIYYMVHVKGASLEKKKNIHFLETAYGTSMYIVCMARVDKQIIIYKSSIKR